MTTSIEGRLRAALAAGADVITDDPVDSVSAPPEPLPSPLPHRALYWSLATAAAVIMLVASLAIALRSREPGPKAGQQTTAGPSPTVPSPSPSPSPRPQGLQPAMCQVPLPSSWRAALQAARVPGQFELQAVAPSGAAIAVARGFQGRDLVLIKRDHSVHELYRAPAPIAGLGSVRIGSATTDGTWVVVELVVGGGQGAVGGIEAIDLGSGITRTVRAIDSSHLPPIIAPPVVLDGVVYWSEVDNVGRGHVYSFDIPSATRRTLDHGAVMGPVAAGGGLFWQNGNRVVSYHSSATFPAGYELRVAKGYSALLRDGHTYAWGRSDSGRLVIEMSADRTAAPVVVVRSKAINLPLAVIGHLLVYDDGAHVRVLDTRTGATTVVAASAGPGQAAAAGGTLVLGSTDAQIRTLRAADLPELRC